MMKDKDWHTILPHVSETSPATVTSAGTTMSVVVISTQALTTNEVLAGAVSGGAILLIMIVSTLVVILIMKRKKTRKKAGDSVTSCTGLRNNMCIVYCSAYIDCSFTCV